MSQMIIYDAIDQGTDEWMKIRLGIPTASMFSALLAKGEGKTRRSYMCRLAAEIITGEPTETFTSPAMERGKVMESEARDWYAFQYNVEPERVGFIVNGPKGCSPDSLLGTNGMLEIKTTRGDLLIEKLLKGEFSPEHKAQCQGALWVAEREWIDLVTYWPRLPPLVVRAQRDELYIAALSKAVSDFNAELQEVVEQIRAYGGGKAAA
ncbi:lambda exonuclease family protein [Xanthobacter autotrophicus]|uniref:lambda exonuclease family protein n=1 Tax=Xanthobacter autotrophicus TaxID=280 RepID=UPI003729C7D4